MAQPINYRPELWQQRGILTLLKLLHDAAFDPDVNDRIVRGDYQGLDQLVRRYLPNASPALSRALQDAATAAKRWVDTYRGTPNRLDDQVARDAYTSNMAVVMESLTKEMHSEDFSLIW
jgi:hypothetical protein